MNLLIQMFITLSSDYIYLLAMLKTTPLIVTVGLALTIPLAVIGDYLFLNLGATPQSILGAVLVVTSFLALGLEGSQEVIESQDELAGYEAIETDDESDIVERGRPEISSKGLAGSSPMGRMGGSELGAKRPGSSGPVGNDHQS